MDDELAMLFAYADLYFGHYIALEWKWSYGLN